MIDNYKRGYIITLVFTVALYFALLIGYMITRSMPLRTLAIISIFCLVLIGILVLLGVKHVVLYMVLDTLLFTVIAAVLSIMGQTPLVLLSALAAEWCFQLFFLLKKSPPILLVFQAIVLTCLKMVPLFSRFFPMSKIEYITGLLLSAFLAWITVIVFRMFNENILHSKENEDSLGDMLKLVDNKCEEARNYSEQLDDYRYHLEEKVDSQTKEIRSQAERLFLIQESTIEGMASLIESRDGNTGRHIYNTKHYVSIMVNYMYSHNLYTDIVDEKFINYMVSAAPLHDVGKIKVSDTILNKPRRLSPEEYEVMKSHATLGSYILQDILGKGTDPEFTKFACDVAHYHHEKWDGTGYPTRMKGENIPFNARIMAVADVYDALCSKRVYKDSLDDSEARMIMFNESGKHFDPDLVKIFFAALDEEKSKEK